MNKTTLSKDDFAKQIQRTEIMNQWVNEFIRERIAPVCIVGIDSTGISCVQLPEGINPKQIINILRDTANNIEQGLKLKIS